MKLNLPLRFEVNLGQIDEKVKFLIKGKGYTTFFTPTEVVLTLCQDQEHKEAYRYSHLKMTLIGARSDTIIVGEQLLAGKANYFMGDNPGKWVSEIPLYEKIRYQEVYPGIDLVYYGQEKQLEHDFLVRPEVDPSQIRLSFQGADQVEINAQGNLSIQTQTGEMQFLKPKAYQEINGVQKEIESAYRIGEAGEVTFLLGEYDQSVLLTIDPVLSYSTFLGGSGDDRGNGIAIDEAGNAYIVGWTTSNNFPTTSGAYDTSFNGYYNVFITKLSADGTQLVYSTYLGGNGGDWGVRVAIDRMGNAYVTGWTTSSNFPTTLGAYDTSYNGGQEDVFITKLSSDGASLVYSTYLGGSSRDVAQDITIDEQGNAYVIGWTFSTNFPTTPGAYSGTLTGWYDGFVTKINADGTGLVYSTTLAGSSKDIPQGIVVDGLGNAYVAGWTDSTNFPTTLGAYRRVNSGESDAFVAKLDPQGSTLLYSTYLGGSSSDVAGGIAIDAMGNAYIVGTTSSSDFPITSGAYDGSYNGMNDAFISKLDPSGANLLYSTYLGGSGDDFGNKIERDTVGNMYVIGATKSNDFPTTEDAYDRSYHGGYDGFLTKLDAGGTGLLYSTYLGGSGDDTPYAIAIDGIGNIYITGSTSSGDFPTTVGAYDRSYNGAEDAFIMKFAPVVEPGMQLPIVVGPPQATDGSSIVIVFSVASPDFDKEILLHLEIQITIKGVFGRLYLTQIVGADGSDYMFTVVLPVGAEIVSVAASYELIG